MKQPVGPCAGPSSQAGQPRAGFMMVSLGPLMRMLMGCIRGCFQCRFGFLIGVSVGNCLGRTVCFRALLRIHSIFG